MQLTEPVFHIVLALADRPRHGYGIIQEVAQATGGRVRLSTGTLYAALQRLLDHKIIIEVPDETGGERGRRSYALTESGRALLDSELGRLAELVSRGREKLGRLEPEAGRP